MDTKPPLEGQTALPKDDGLPGLHLLSEGEWVWRTYCGAFGAPAEIPRRIRPRQITYTPGARALISYSMEWPWRRWVIESEFAVELVDGKAPRIFRYPDDPYLPGLHGAASAQEAHALLRQHASINPHRVRVEPVRYRPAHRAVIRHIISWRRTSLGRLELYARVMPPSRVARLVKAAELVHCSHFALPEAVGCWAEGGVVWLTRVRGHTVRSLVRQGEPPDPEPILDGLASLWAVPIKPDQGQPLNLLGGFRMTQRLLAHILSGSEARRLLQRAVDTLGPLCEAWQPSAVAHNDFYDDQLILTPEGRLVLVDFEEAGPGDPQFDIGNILGHLRWMARFGLSPDACLAFRRSLRSVALRRFGWEERALDWREALAIFRLAANPFRQMQANWESVIESALALAVEVLESR
jgi:hypothetical protein